jgi:hypothetical protein
MIVQLKELKDTYESAKQALVRGREPMEDLIKMNAFLKTIVEDPLIIMEYVDKEFRKFFFEELTVGALKSLTKEKSRDEKVRVLLIVISLSSTWM